MVKNYGEYIKREDVVRTIMSLPNCENGFSDTYDKSTIIGVLEDIPTAQMWIHVNNRLPDRNMWCLVICNEPGGRITRIAIWFKKRFEEICSTVSGLKTESKSKDITRFVTHWMELPQRPEKHK